MFKVVVSPLTKFLDRFMVRVGITEESYPDPKHYQFAKATIVYSWLAGLVAISYAIFYFYIGAYQASLSLGAMSLVIVLCHLLYLVKRPVLLAQIDLAFACVALAGVVLHTGGISTSAAAWLLGTVPGIAALLFKRLSYIVSLTAFTIFLYGCVFALELRGYNVHQLGYAPGSTFERVYTFIHYVGFSLFFAVILSIFSVTQRNLYDRLQQNTTQLEHVLANLNIVFETIDQAIFTVERDGVIGESRSEKFETILHSSHKTLYSILDKCRMSSSDIATIKEIVDFAIGEDSFQFHMNCHLLPQKLYYRLPQSDIEKILAVQWSPIESEGVVRGLLVAIQDISDIEAAKTTLAEKNKHHEILLSLVENANSALGTKMRTLSALTNRLKTAVQAEDIREAKGLIHTIKGNTRQLNIKNISDYCHEIESILEKDQGEFNRVCQTLIDLLEEYADVYQAHFASFDNETRDMTLFAEAQSLIERLAPDNEILNRLKLVSQVNIQTLLSPVIAESRGIASTLGKPPPSFLFKGLKYSIPPDYRDTILNVIGHLVRNSIDHGFEEAEERLRKAKPESGEIHITIAEQSGGLGITYRDDGRGLNTGKIAEKARAVGIDTQDLDLKQTCELIFHEDFTTSSSVTQFSGRGVGMTAVARDIERIGGLIEIDVTGTRADHVSFEICINLPPIQSSGDGFEHQNIQSNPFTA